MNEMRLQQKPYLLLPYQENQMEHQDQANHLFGLQFLQ